MTIIKPQKRKTSCCGFSNKLNLKDTSEDLATQETIDGWEENIGKTIVYRNFDFSKPLKAIVIEGNYEKQEYPYKSFQSYPYEKVMFSKGDYISFKYNTIDGKRMITTLMATLDSQFTSVVKAHIYHCNNTLNFVDKYGYVRKYPVVFNDSGQRTDFYFSSFGINTQSSRVECDIRQDKYTDTIKVNDRFVFDGVAFKVTYVGKHSNNFFDSEDGNITLMLTIDENRSTDDDLENDIASVSRLNAYKIHCETERIHGGIDSVGKIIAYITKDEKVVDEELAHEIIKEDIINTKCNLACNYGYAKCEVPKDNVIEVDNYGNYKLLKLGECKLKVYMKNNPNKFAIIDVIVDEKVIEDVERIEITPIDFFVRQGESKEFICKKYINNIETDTVLDIKDISDIVDGRYTIDIGINKFTIHNIKQIKNKKVEVVVSDGVNSKTVNIELRGVW